MKQAGWYIVLSPVVIAALAYVGMYMVAAKLAGWDTVIPEDKPDSLFDWDINDE